MKRVIFCFAAVSVFLLTAFGVSAQEQASEPIFKEGDFWQFKVKESDFQGKSSNPTDGTFDCVFSNGTIKMFRVTGDQKEQLKSRPRVLLIVFGIDKFEKDLQFPLFVGKKWTYDYEAAATGAKQKLDRHVTITVTGIEQVTTPAGTFRAFKLEKDDRVTGRNFYTISYYYSPEAKVTIKSFADFSGVGTAGKREIELVKFGPAR